MKEIAVVRLAPGQVGFYDDLTRIHLTIAKPVEAVYSHMNTEKLKRAVAYRRIILVSGTLDPETNIENSIKINEPVVNRMVDNKEKSSTRGARSNFFIETSQEEIKEDTKDKEKVESTEDNSGTVDKEVENTEEVNVEVNQDVKEEIQVEIKEEVQATEEVEDTSKKKGKNKK